MAGPRSFPHLEAELAAEEGMPSRMTILLGVTAQQLEAIRNGEHVLTAELEAKAAAATGVDATLLFVPDPAVEHLIRAAVDQGHGRKVTDPALYRQLAETLRAEAC